MAVRQLIATLVAACMAIALTACGGGGGGSSDGGGSAQVEKPAIGTQPADQTVVTGSAATFTVAATGGGTLAYQWKKNGTDIPGATASTYTTPATSNADHDARFTVVVTNSAGAATSNAARLAVTAAAVAPAISSQPASQSVVTGSAATFTVAATGGGTLAYQWKKNGIDIPGATASTYTTPATSIADHDARFSVVVTNSAGAATSNDASLTVTAEAEAPAITSQPENLSVTTGTAASFSVVASGTSPFGYQWKKNGADIPGATSSTYTTPATSSADIGAELLYSVVVTNGAGTATSNTARLTVTAAVVAPGISSQPAPQTVGAGQTASFLVIATGTSPGYQWKKNGTDIPGATASSYTTPATRSADNGAVFTVEVRNSAGSVTSSEARLKVGLGITTQPADQTVAPGNTATFSVVATGIGTVRYQWKKRGGVIAGATESTYTTPATDQTFDTGAWFTVVVTDDEGTVTSSKATLIVSKFSLVANASVGGTYALTECVKDNRTGLIWEGKPTSGERSTDKIYTNYDSKDSAQKFDGPNSRYVNPEQSDIDAPTNSIGHRNFANDSSLCGFTDWRLPTIVELEGILNAIQATTPKIDTQWFPNTQAAFYWSASPFGNDILSTMGVDFNLGRAYQTDRFFDTNHYLRLVRSSQ